jgi:hypothetical protein
MDRVQVFLRNPLFTSRENSHVPAQAVILEGEVQENRGAGVLIKVSVWLDKHQEDLGGDPKTLFIPPSKIDHIFYLD